MADAYIEKGTTYEIDGKVYECLEFLHVKPRRHERRSDREDVQSVQRCA